MIHPYNSPAFTLLFVSICLTASTAVFGCGQLPQGQVTVLRFTVMGSVLPVEMGYSETNMVQNQVPSISTSEQMARTRVERQIIGTVEDVLAQQGRDAFLPDVLVSQILQQLTINISYTPIKCVTASINGMPIANFNNMREGCFINGGLITHLCMMNNCQLLPAVMHIESITQNYMTISGRLETSNIIMANWSKQMWEDVLRRVHRRLSSTSTPFGTFFSRAAVTVDN